MDLYLDQWRNKGGSKGDVCPRAQRFGVTKLRSACSVIITKCQMSMDAINYDSRKCRMPASATHLRNLIKIAMVPKANIYEPW